MFSSRTVPWVWQWGLDFVMRCMWLEDGFCEVPQPFPSVLSLSILVNTVGFNQESRSLETVWFYVYIYNLSVEQKKVMSLRTVYTLWYKLQSTSCETEDGETETRPFLRPVVVQSYNFHTIKPHESQRKLLLLSNKRYLWFSDGTQISTMWTFNYTTLSATT